MLLKKFLLTGMAVLLSVSFILTGCPTDSGDGTVAPPEKSGNVRLAADSVVEGEPVGAFRGGDGNTFGSLKTASVTIGTARSEGNAPTTFTAADAKATVAVVFVATAGTDPTDEGTFNTALQAGAFTNGATVRVPAGTFYIRVTAENGAVKWYTITVTVEASNDATLKRVVVKDVVVPASVFTTGDGAAIGTAKAATVTIGTAPAPTPRKRPLSRKTIPARR
jgi:hypothetical protein